MMRPAADGRAKRHDNLIGGRRIGDRRLDRQIMRATAFVVLVHERNHDRRVGRSARIAEGQIGLGADGVAIVITEPERVDQGGSMFDLAVQPDDRRLAIGLDCLARSDRIDDHFGQQFAEDGSNGVNLGL